MACGILAPRPGIEPTPPALEARVLTTGTPGKSPILLILNNARSHLPLIIDSHPHPHSH